MQDAKIVTYVGRGRGEIVMRNNACLPCCHQTGCFSQKTSLLVKNLQFLSKRHENLRQYSKFDDNFFLFYKKIDTQNFGKIFGQNFEIFEKN